MSSFYPIVILTLMLGKYLRYEISAVLTTTECNCKACTDQHKKERKEKPNKGGVVL